MQNRFKQGEQRGFEAVFDSPILYLTDLATRIGGDLVHLVTCPKETLEGVTFAAGTGWGRVKVAWAVLKLEQEKIDEITKRAQAEFERREAEQARQAKIEREQ